MVHFKRKIIGKKKYSKICFSKIILFFLFLSFFIVGNRLLASGAVVLTLDDGNSFWVEEAAPFLQQYDVRPVGFIALKFIREGYISEEQINILKDSFHWEIGSHSETHHIKKDSIPELIETGKFDYARNEFINSKKALENILGIPVQCFAFPGGATSSEAESMGLEYYKILRTTVYLENTDDVLNNFDQRIFKGLGTDKIYKIPLNKLKTIAKKAFDDNKVLVLYLHNITEYDTEWKVEKEYMKEFINYCKKIGIPFLTFEDISKMSCEKGN